MKKLIFIVAVIVLAIFEATILNYFRFFHVEPNLLLIAVVLASLSFKTGWAIFFSIFIGILKDIFSVYVFGINTLLFPLWGFLIIRLSKQITLDNNFIRMVVVFIAVILNNLAARLILFCLGNFIALDIFFRATAIESLYTAVISPLIFRIPHETKDI